MKHEVVTSIFLGLAGLAAIIGCLGLLRMRGAAAKLHFAGWISLTVLPAVMAAIVSQEGLSEAGTRAIFIVVISFLEAPVVIHVLGRAIHTYERPEK